jgi:hypothetical protein
MRRSIILLTALFVAALVSTSARGQAASYGASPLNVAPELSLIPKYLAGDPSGPPADTSAPSSGGAQDQEALAKAAQNPIANMISLPFQNNFNFGIGPNNSTQWNLNVQPVIPISLGKDWNLITRTIIPIVYQPSPAPGVQSVFGLGDINPQFFFSPAKPGALIWGAGPTFTFPTATDSLLGAGKWSAGPAAVLLTIQGHWVFGAVANQQWSFAGWGNQNVSALVVQPFVNYNLPDGWYLVSSPIITANWEADSNDTWTVPVGAGIGKIFKIGKQAFNAQLQAFDNVVRPNNGPTWQLRFQIQLLFPK